jgi:hypothetical protein
MNRKFLQTKKIIQAINHAFKDKHKAEVFEKKKKVVSSLVNWAIPPRSDQFGPMILLENIYILINPFDADISKDEEESDELGEITRTSGVEAEYEDEFGFKLTKQNKRMVFFTDWSIFKPSSIQIDIQVILKCN